jgi:hypothetical protein
VTGEWRCLRLQNGKITSYSGDGCSRFLWNVVAYIPNSTACYIPEDDTWVLCSRERGVTLFDALRNSSEAVTGGCLNRMGDRLASDLPEEDKRHV